MTSSSSAMSGSTHPQAASSSGPSSSAPMAMSAPKATSSHVMSAPELAAQGLLFRKPRNQPSALPSAAGALPYEGSAPPPPPAHSQPYHQPSQHPPQPSRGYSNSSSDYQPSSSSQSHGRGSGSGAGSSYPEDSPSNRNMFSEPSSWHQHGSPSGPSPIRSSAPMNPFAMPPPAQQEHSVSGGWNQYGRGGGSSSSTAGWPAGGSDGPAVDAPDNARDPRHFPVVHNSRRNVHGEPFPMRPPDGRPSDRNGWPNARDRERERSPGWNRSDGRPWEREREASRDWDRSRQHRGNGFSFGHHGDDDESHFHGDHGERDEASGASGGAGGAQQAGADRKVSCMECRGSKVKCTGAAPGESCARCVRLGRSCVFEPHRRGRRPDSAKYAKLERSLETLLGALGDIRKSNAQESDKEKDTDDAGADPAQATLRKQLLALISNSAGDADKGEESASGNIDQANTSERSGSVNSPMDDAASAPSRASKRQRTRSTSSREASSAMPIVVEPPSPRSSENVEGANFPKDVDESENSKEEPANLGLPPLSNPLKLLAQASSAHSANNPASPAVPSTPISSGLEHRRSAGANAATYWTFGLYSARLDTRPGLCPIAGGLVSESAAEILWTLFMNHLNSPITLLDPNLATFAYARSHSALLLTAACALAARFALELPDAAGIASRLDSHIQTTILPAVLMEGFRSPEIAQALIIMAAYHNPTKTLADDRSWSLLGYGQRIASELDMNSSILSAKVGRQNGASSEGDDHSGSAELDEGFQRRLRSRERTWMNLFLFEQSLSTHMGRRSTLVVDPVVRESAAGWHRAPFAIADDEAVVAVLQLRLCVRKHLEFFDRSVAGGGAEHAALQLEFFRQSAKADVDAWRATWCEQRSGTYRMRNGRLYANYALIILYSFALRSTHVPTESLAPIYRDSFEASLTYLTLFLDIFTPQKLIYSNNSSTVTVAYVSVFALKLTALDPDKQRFAYIDADQTFSLVGRVASALAAAGSVTPWREGCAGSYAPYLSAVLARARRAYRKRQQEGGTQVSGQHDLVASSGDPQAGGRDTNSDSHVQGGASQKRARASGEHSVVGDVSPSHSSPDAFAFHAGPSGVQSSAANAGTLENGNQPWDAQNHDMVSHLLESSLFTDMSFVSTGAGWEGAFEWPVGV